ncbi:MAG: isoprenoid biosynthesis glyoxalase ElbB [Deltaproteobacteria bacterium]|nr:isoprenoid biosynthesis glyoxalase ElbB [Deltaproteobacteria bacterium]
MKKIAVVLSGCGVMDGSEIHEAVITLLALDRAGAQAIKIAPNIELEEINHLTNQPTGKKRNVLQESARIARGDIKDIAVVKASDVDGLIFPGGYGAAKNLCDFATKGAEAKPHPEVARLVKEVYAAKKPIGALCIAPALMACILGRELHPELTIGNDAGTAAALEKMGARHVAVTASEIVIDKQNKIVSTPAYMCARSIKEAADGIEKLVTAVLKLA